MKRTNVQISKKLRIETIIPILKGLELKDVSNELNIPIKTLKYRLTQIYKYYGVKNRLELMALYIKIPTPFYRFTKGLKRPSRSIKKSKVTYSDAQERFDQDIILPFNKNQISF